MLAHTFNPSHWNQMEHMPFSVYACTYVYRCTHVCVETRGKPQVQFLRSYLPLLTWNGQSRQGWLARVPQQSSGPLLSSAGLKHAPLCPHFVSCGCWESDSSLHAFKANILPHLLFLKLLEFVLDMCLCIQRGGTSIVHPVSREYKTRVI